MAAISTNAIPATAPAPAKANAHDVKARDPKKPGEESFAALLNAVGAQAPAAQPVPSGKDGAQDDSHAEDASAGDSSSDTASAKTQADKSGAAKGQASGKPGAKDAQPAHDKSANDHEAAAALLQPNSADANVMAEAAQLASAQLAAQQPQQPAVHDDAGDGEEVEGVAKSGAKPAPAAPSTAEDPAAAASKSPAEAAQAALTGANDKGDKDGKLGKGADSSEKAPAKAADAGNTPKTEAPQQPQAAQAATPAPSITASAAAQAPGAPVQTAGSHTVSTSVAVTPQPAQPMPDVNGLAVEIAARSQSGAKQFSIRLDPPELGRVDVRLSIDATGKAEAHLTADHPDTLNLLQRDSSVLSQALRESGLDVSRDGLNFSLRDQNSQTGHNHGNQGRGSRANLAATRVQGAAQSASSIAFTGAGTGRLDIHV